MPGVRQAEAEEFCRDLRNALVAIQDQSNLDAVAWDFQCQCVGSNLSLVIVLISNTHSVTLGGGARPDPQGVESRRVAGINGASLNFQDDRLRRIHVPRNHQFVPFDLGNDLRRDKCGFARGVAWAQRELREIAQADELTAMVQRRRQRQAGGQEERQK